MSKVCEFYLSATTVVHLNHCKLKYRHDMTLDATFESDVNPRKTIQTDVYTDKGGQRQCELNSN